MWSSSEARFEALKRCVRAAKGPASSGRIDWAAMTNYPDAEAWDAVIADIGDRMLSRGQKTMLRFGLWCWNGSELILVGDLVDLDNDNRRIVGDILNEVLCGK